MWALIVLPGGNSHARTDVVGKELEAVVWGCEGGEGTSYQLGEAGAAGVEGPGPQRGLKECQRWWPLSLVPGE